MAVRDTPFAPGTPCWVDLFTVDPVRSKKFYTGVFGWDYFDSGEEYGGYVMCMSDGKQVAGMMKNPPESTTPDVWTTYLETADIHASTATAQQAGATTIVEPMAVGDIGSMAVLIDPAGGAFGLWQSLQHTGFHRYNEPNSVTWDEHHSKDFAASRTFYEKVFNWTYDVTSDTDDFRYLTAQVDGESVAGLMDSAHFLPPEVPTHWAVYFSTDDAEAAEARAVELGATVLHSAKDTPFGRIVDLLDCTGAPFKLHQAAAS